MMMMMIAMMNDDNDIDDAISDDIGDNSDADYDNDE